MLMDEIEKKIQLKKDKKTNSNKKIKIKFYIKIK
jgi:hypothetical protein